MSETIKPCPFCGSELKVYGPEDWSPTFYDPDSGGEPYRAHCDCGFEFSIGCCEWDEFAKALNRRSEPSGKAEPLKIEELRQMDGQPVFVVNLNNRNNSRWEIIKGTNEPNALDFFSFRDSIYFIRSYGKTWLAYRRRPESEEK